MVDVAGELVVLDGTAVVFGAGGAVGATVVEVFVGLGMVVVEAGALVVVVLGGAVLLGAVVVTTVLW